MFNWSKLPQEVKKELIYVIENKDLVQLMKKLHLLIEDFSNIFKSKGINDYRTQLWLNQQKKRLEEWRMKGEKIHLRVEQYLECTNSYIEQTKIKIQGYDQILCCSDAIESVFGKYKNKGGAKMISDDALTIAAYGKNITLEDMSQALLQTKMKDIQAWKTENTTPSFQVIRRQALKKVVA